MVTALVLMSVERGQVARIAREIGAIPDVVEVHSVTGPYDLVAKVQVSEMGAWPPTSDTMTTGWVCTASS